MSRKRPWKARVSHLWAPDRYSVAVAYDRQGEPVSIAFPVDLEGQEDRDVSVGMSVQAFEQIAARIVGERKRWRDRQEREALLAAQAEGRGRFVTPVELGVRARPVTDTED